MAYSLGADHDRRMVRLTLRESWTPETFDTFQRDLRRHVLRLGWAPLTYTCLVDARDRGIQPKEMTRPVQEALSEREQIIQPRRQAVVVASMLAKLQAERLNGTTSAVFLSEQEAVDWLDERS